MYKLVQRLTNNSLINRSWTVLSNYSTTSHVSFSSESLATSGLVESFGKDKETRSTSNISHVVAMINDNYTHMNKNEVITALNVLYKSVDKRPVPLDLTKIEGFEHMCNLIHKEVTSLNTFDVIRVLKILTFFEIPPHTALVTALLQSLINSINELSLGQLKAVHNILTQMEETSMVIHLKTIIFKTFTTKASTEITSNTPHLFGLLKFCISINDQSTILRIANILARDTSKIDLNYVVDVYRAVCGLRNETPSMKMLMQHLHGIILSNVITFKVQDIISLLRCMVEKIQDGQTEFYDLNTIYELERALLIKDTSYNQKLFVLKLFNSIRYSCPRLIDQIAKKYEQMDANEKKYQFDNNALINACVIANHKPRSWKKFEETLRSETMLRDYSIFTAAPLAFRMLSLDIYQPELLDKIFKLCNDVSELPKDSLLDVLRLYWCVKTLHPDYEGAMLDENRLNQLNRFLLEMDDACNLPNFRQNLETAAGGANYVKHGLRTRFGEFVDVVIVQSDGTLMNISSFDNVTFAEELTSFPDCTKILFFSLPDTAFSIKGERTLTTVKLLLKTIEILPGFSPFVVCSKTWGNHKRQISLLEEAIKSRSSVSTN